MMRIVDFDHQIGNGELQLMRPQPLGLVLGRKAEAWPEKQQDIGGVGDDVPAVLHGRRGLVEANGKARRRIFAWASSGSTR